MKSIYKLLGIGVFILLLNQQMLSQDIETLWDIDVTTASKHEEKITDAPGIISVVTKEEIQGFGAVTLSDVLNRVTSMYMIHAGTFMWNVGSIRGQNISNSDNHVLILINGRPYRDGMSGGFNSVTYIAFPVETIDHIEIIRGPGSVLYGTNAYSGVINIITNVADEESSYKATLGYGSYNTLTGSFSGGVHFNDDLNLNFGLNYFNDDGPEFEFMDTPLQIPSGDSAINIPSQSGKGNFTRDNKSLFLNLNFKGLHFNTLYSDLYPFGLALPFKWKINSSPPNGAGIEMTSFKRYFADLGYTFSFNDKYSLDVNLTYNWFKAEGWVQDDNNQNATKGLTNNPIFEIAFNASPVENLNFIAGGVFDYNKFEGAQMTDGDLTKYGVYFQADYRIRWIKFILGGQFNKVENIDANVSPRIGAIVNINDNWGIKALYSTAFRNAYPIETNVNHPAFSGNPNLNPELISTFDGQLFFHNDIVQTSLTYFKSHLSQLINRVPNPDEPGKMIYQNIGTFDFSGIEFEGKFGITDKLSLLASATYQQNEKNDSLKNAAYWPQFIAKGGLLYKHEYFSFGIWDNYFGEPTQIPNPLVTSNPKAEAFNELSANFTFNFSKVINKDMKTKILLSVYCDNLLNSDPSWYPEFSLETVNSMPLHTGRSFYGKLTVQF